MGNIGSDLLTLVERFRGARIFVVGDLILDHYIWGDVSRISPEAPVVVVNVDKEERSLGGAGNVVNNLIELGAEVAVAGAVGEDDEGIRLCGMLESKGVNTSGIVTIGGRPTTVKTRVLARAQQVVRVDRESTETLPDRARKSIAEAVATGLKNTKGVVVSDYAKGVLSPDVFRPFEEANNDGLFGIGKVPLVIDPKNANFDLYSCGTVVKPNRGEAAIASGINIRDRRDAASAGRLLAERWSSDMVLVTLGELGMVLVPRDSEIPVIEVDTEAREIYDVSGAGDTVAAVFTLALAVGASPKDAACLANISAGIVVAEVGAVALKFDQLTAALETASQ